MTQLFPYLLILPLTALVICFVADNRQEKIISGAAITALALFCAGSIIIAGYWFYSPSGAWLVHGFDLYKSDETNFSLNFYFDDTTCVYILVSALLALLVSIFSKFYMHREKGYKRFYTNLLFFFVGLNTVLIAGNFETLFIGWEVLGVTSFFLISFYRDRYLPVKNALKVVSLYRLADIALLLGVWLCHHRFGKSISFSDLQSLTINVASYQFFWPIPAVLLVSVLIKSAQFPFTSWLPRAMEGPTTSSAIFYGSLSVHIGIFLLLRTYPLWQMSNLFTAIVIVFGTLTVLMATLAARVQSTVKTQIAYSSAAQIGLMMIEVALGLHWLALLHFAANAFLRSYQLLVSPSVLSYQIHDQFFNFNKPQHYYPNSFWGKLKMSVFIWSIKEWNMDYLLKRLLWNPLKWAGNKISVVVSNVAIAVFFVPLFAVGLYLVYHKSILATDVLRYAPEITGIAALVLVIRAFTERKKAVTGWLLLILSQLFTSLSIGFNEEFSYSQVHIFLSGIILCGAGGVLILRKLQQSGKAITLQQFHGHSYEHPRLAFAFVLACLGLAGFPITPTFIGEDLMLGHIHEQQLLLTLITALNLILDGLVVFRIYSRLFLGPHEKGYHETAYRSS